MRWLAWTPGPRHRCRHTIDSTHRNTDSKPGADTRHPQRCPLLTHTAVHIHREMLTYRLTDTPEDTHVPTQTDTHGDTQRYKLLPQTSRCSHSHTHTNTHTGHSHSSPVFLAQLHMAKLSEKKNNVRACGGGEGDRKSECQQGPENGWGVRRGSSGWAPMCWAFPVAPKLTGWQGGGHCHILSASGICQAWHGAWQGGGGPLLPGIPSLSRRGRAGATQAPNGFQAPTLKAGVGSRLNSSSPPSSLALPLLGVREEDEEQWGQGGSAQLSCRPRVP